MRYVNIGNYTDGFPYISLG